MRPARRFSVIRSVLAAGTLALLALPLAAQDARQQIALSGPAFTGWQFFGAATAADLPAYGSSGFNSGPFQDVPVPHLYQSRLQPATIQAGWYKLNYTVPSALAGKRLYLVFEGAAAIADVYVNGQHLGQHRGAYTRFTFDATSALTVGGNNVIAVRVDDDPADTADCLPSGKRLYTVWGGLYRHVWLLATDPVHIDPTDFSSPGVYITPTSVTSASANLSIQALIRNTLASVQSVQVDAALQDPAGATVATYTANATVPANARTSVTLKGTLSNPKLWAPGSPNLYHVVTSVAVGGQTLDSVTQPTGFRTLGWTGWVSKSSGGVVALNGKAILLRGADLHQEIEGKLSAVEDSDLLVNFNLMQDLGVNWVRFSHYPRAQYEYDQCDQLGILCWTENGHTNPDEPTATADTITTEWVKQNYNHPSIAVWSVGNEASGTNGEAVAEREVPVVKALDPTRDVVVANMVCKTADFIANNTYPGWYGGDRWSFQGSGYVTETGAGGVVTSHTDYTTGKFTVNSFEPEEYQQLVAEARFQSAINNTKLGMFTWWALRDFTDTKYKAPEGLNTKGLTTYAGDPKDVYYLLRCFLRPDVRTVRLTSKRYFLRRGSATDGVKAYSNAPSLTLTLNGQVVSTLANGKYAQKDSSYSGNQTVADVFFWPAQFHTGANTISVSDGSGNTDSATVYFYGSGGLPALPVTNPLVTNLSSSNSANPAYYMNMPVQPQWPIYYDFDSTADNSFDDVPPAVQGATWIATHRVTKSGLSTALSFTVTDNATIYVMCTKTGSAPAFLAGFTETNDAGLVWRDNNLNLVPAQLFSRQVSANESISIPAADRDALVMFQRTGGGTPQVAAPVFSPGGGSYSSAQTVTLTSATDGASIRYTTDGSTPSETAGTLYSSPVDVTSDATLNAIAYEAGFSDSPVSTASYAIGTGGGSTTVSFEAESLAYTPSGATASVQTDSNSSGGKWVELAGNSTGDFIDFTVPGVPAGTYQLQMEWKGNNSRGILQLSVDGTGLGPALDQYASGQTYPTTTFGPVTFGSAGSHTIRLTVTGKNSKSGAYQLSADKFIFAGQ